MFRSFWRVTESLGVLIVLYKRESSANSLNFVPLDKPLEISLIYTRKKRGPKTVPCGTPERTLDGLDDIPSTTTLCFLPIRKDLIQFKSEFLIPRCSSFKISPSWSTLTNAFEISSKMASIYSRFLGNLQNHEG